MVLVNHVRNGHFPIIPLQNLDSGVIKFRINQDFLIEHSCIMDMRS